MPGGGDTVTSSVAPEAGSRVARRRPPC